VWVVVRASAVSTTYKGASSVRQQAMAGAKSTNTVLKKPLNGSCADEFSRGCRDKVRSVIPITVKNVWSSIANRLVTTDIVRVVVSYWVIKMNSDSRITSGTIKEPVSALSTKQIWLTTLGTPILTHDGRDSLTGPPDETESEELAWQLIRVFSQIKFDRKQFNTFQI
jgi:hypothetical protein